MAAWIWILIPLVAIVGGLIVEYQKNKLSMMNRSQQNESELDDLRELVESLTGRIENLEAIAASEPDEFSRSSSENATSGKVDFKESFREENKQQVSKIAENRRKRNNS